MPTDTWWHYTDANGLLGILKSGKLWASCISYLNDAAEVAFGLEILETLLKEEGDSPRRPIWPHKTHPLTRSAQDVYAISFSAEGDLLSQWRGYAGRAGYAMGFSTEFMYLAYAHTVGGAYPEPYAIRYGEDARHHLRNDLQGRLDVRDRRLEDDDAWALLRNLPRYKHGSFSEEQEWRIAVLEPTPESVEFRERNGRLLPYVEVPLPQAAFTDIRLGPGSTYDDVAAVELALRRYGWGENIRVTESTSPYR